MRVPDRLAGIGPCGELLPEVEACWFINATVRASSYVVPPIMKTIMSCGLGQVVELGAAGKSIDGNLTFDLSAIAERTRPGYLDMDSWYL